jgi:hypothetical protein
MRRREAIKALVGAPQVVDEARERRIKWFREAKFGMFIHWGLYAIPAGIWKGKEIPGIGEWIMFRARIPVKEYAQLAKQFNPTKFNADEWVQLAKRLGNDTSSSPQSIMMGSLCMTPKSLTTT